VQVTVAGDVDNPLCGPQGAAAVFGPQKGASPADVRELDAALSRWAGILATTTGQDAATVRDTPGAGAAGGVGAALATVFGASLRSGAELLLDLVDFTAACRDADLVLTGEGRIDAQTGHGKAPARVAAAAHAATAGTAGGVPVIAVAGAATADAATLVPDVLADIVTVGDPARPVAENLARTATDLRITVARRMSVFSHCQRQ
jgi:glycerate kinase